MSVLIGAQGVRRRFLAGCYFYAEGQKRCAFLFFDADESEEQTKKTWDIVYGRFPGVQVDMAQIPDQYVADFAPFAGRVLDEEETRREIVPRLTRMQAGRRPA